MAEADITRIRDDYRRVADNVDRVARSAGRNSEEIRIVVVTKSQTVETINAAISAGIRLFGENYPEEAREKIAVIETRESIQWHMIGHLQTRKIKIFAENFHMLHSLDSYRLANKLNMYLEGNQLKPIPVLLEMNVSGEESKFGFSAWNEETINQSLADIEKIMGFSYLRVLGVMAMPPLFDDPEASRPYHRKLYNIFNQLKKLYPDQSWQEVSSGTSYDYEIAIQEGATYLRIGQAILGARAKR
ncbi:MAG: YggS family pyridoxal phosphate-dependent enzyme [Anaerolineae bacterium]|nr:YggS family pyridoxal phosphate-dependent enzyme [Anaerolineae bacterium]